MHVSLPLFLVVFTWVLLSIALGLKFYEWSRQREMSAMLRTAAEDPMSGGSQLLRKVAAKPPQLEVWLEHLTLLEKTRKLIRQAGVNWTPGGLLLTPLLFYDLIGFVVLRTSLTPHLRLYYWPRRA